MVETMVEVARSWEGGEYVTYSPEGVGLHFDR